ncbi:glycosyltransferase family 4 protein [Sphingobium algorifonticola]|uniref:Glycosyltransferase family 4 protein n=1 Tax=Sphingobium algorifonticola TaxID=2008318 RepID=A0A437J9X9_9SPHN|nr:glycosyltransferase family 4 protein [Sphingobium algorifonticola]RVT42284.1 glycosyltransferase family 4 protein [Sphingobium algorifonticola]
MRIGIIAHLKHPIAEPFAGGLEMHTHLLARALRQRGHAVTIFASSRSETSLGLEAICSETAIASVGTAEATDIAFFQEHHAYLSLMNGLRHRPFDIIHNNSLHYLPVTMADSLPMPMVTTLHTPPFCWLESGIRLCSANNNALVGVSQSVANLWAHVQPVDAVILNGIDLEKFAFHADPDPDDYLVWYGRIVAEKGLHLAIAAARQIGLPLRIAGPILDEAYFRDVVAPMLGKDAIHVGHLAHNELARLVGGARAFLCTPLWDEPYGLVVAEALACGVPVAAFARGAIPEIVNDSCGVLAKPDDVRSLAEAGRAALSLDRHACRTRAEEICDARRMVDSYENLYRRMIRSAAHNDSSGHDVPSRFASPNPPIPFVQAERSRAHG